MSNKLAGKVALVTGASKGIGAAIATHLAAAGAAVAVNYASSQEGADRVVAEITGKQGKALALKGNVANPADAERLVVETNKALGRIDILVNNAGVYAFAPIDRITPELFHRQFNINVLGLLLVTKEVVEQIGPQGGSIINISSVASTAGLPDSSVYAGTKGAVDSITRALAAELGPRKIRVNAISPGMVETEGVRSAGIAGSDWQKQMVAETPLGRIGQPADIAPAAVFLASDGAGWLTGEIIPISGGNR